MKQQIDKLRDENQLLRETIETDITTLEHTVDQIIVDVAALDTTYKQTKNKLDAMEIRVDDLMRLLETSKK